MSATVKDIVNKLKEDKVGAEANVVGLLYKSPNLIYESESLNSNDFHSDIWKNYFSIAKRVIDDGKSVLDEVTIGLFVNKFPKVKSFYENNGGYESIEKICEYVEEENFSGYLKELAKYNVLIEGYEKGILSTERYSDYKFMELEDIYLEKEAMLNDLFAKATDTNIKSYNAVEGLHSLIDELNEGVAVGFPYFNAPLLNDMTGGSLVGNITMLGALSGMGKSTMTAMYYMPSIIKHNEKVVIMINEEDEKKWKRELLIMVANNLLKNGRKITKKEVRNGNFSDEVMDILRKSADKLEQLKENKNITIIPFTKYKTSLAIKVIKKYASMGVKYFILDTFKVDSDIGNESAWENMQRSSVELHDTIKPIAKNVHLWFTFQLGKQSSKQRYYSQDNIGMAKNIVDVASTCIMIRKMLESEKESLAVFIPDKTDSRIEVPVPLDTHKRYVIIFVAKNRMGSADEVQIVAECDLSKNIYREIGYCRVPEDF